MVQVHENNLPDPRDLDLLCVTLTYLVCEGYLGCMCDGDGEYYRTSFNHPANNK